MRYENIKSSSWPTSGEHLIGWNATRGPSCIAKHADSECLPITHDFLATMLGTGRPSVSLAAGILQTEQIIQYTRGAVKILNRKKLEEASCECYHVIHQYDAQLGLK